MGGFGSNPSRGKDPASSSPSRPDSAERGNRRRILVVEDNNADVYLIRQAIQAAELNADLDVVQDGEKAIRFFDRVDQDESAACPVLVIIDINLPKRPGGEVLREMRKSRRCAGALVVVVTSSDSSRDRDDMARLGANAYFRKPSDYESFLKLGEVAGALLRRGGI